MYDPFASDLSSTLPDYALLDTVKVEDVLNSTERSAWIDFKGYMNTSMRYDYFDECK